MKRGCLANVSQTNLNNSKNLMKNLVKFPVESLFWNQQVALSVSGPKSSRKVLAVVVRRCNAANCHRIPELVAFERRDTICSRPKVICGTHTQTEAHRQSHNESAAEWT